MLEHGGNLNAYIRHYDIDRAHWLDLSTGINPVPWPVEKLWPLPDRLWSHLPESDDGLIEVAKTYYGAHCLLPVAGSQAAIMALPHLYRRCHVGVLAPSYAEHAQAWQQAGHSIISLAADEIDDVIDRLDILVIVNPNNPTGMVFDRDQLLNWHAHLAARGGTLIVDEAFIDSTPACSLAAEARYEGLVVLRSLGKFFGLAGLRAGFVFAASVLLEKLESFLGPWTLTSATRYIVRHALSDRLWQQTARKTLAAQSAALARMLSHHNLEPSGGTNFFQWVRLPKARSIHEALASRGILVRCFDAPDSLRFGLPALASDLARLDDALTEVMSDGERVRQVQA